MAKKTTETVDESILDPSKIAVNSDTVDETPDEDTIAPASDDTKEDTIDKEGEDTLGIPRPPVVVPDVFGSSKDEDPYDTDEFETKIMKATGIMHPAIDKLIAAIKDAKDDEAKEAAKKHLIWHIPAGAGCKHHDDLVAEVNAL